MAVMAQKAPQPRSAAAPESWDPAVSVAATNQRSEEATYKCCFLCWRTSRHECSFCAARARDLLTARLCLDLLCFRSADASPDVASDLSTASIRAFGLVSAITKRPRCEGSALSGDALQDLGLRERGF